MNFSKPSLIKIRNKQPSNFNVTLQGIKEFLTTKIRQKAKFTIYQVKEN